MRRLALSRTLVPATGGEGCWEAQNIRLAWPADLRVTHYPGRSSQRPTTAFAASLSVRVAALFAHPVVGLVAVGVHAKGVWRGPSRTLHSRIAAGLQMSA